MHVVGTAGHVDHGKSSLVRALTGTGPDRFIEERLRGMTLDLGFAHLRFPDGLEAAIVDAPGHERFLHNMLAGAAGIEILLLVIAANEGPQAQTYEHLAILRYFHVKKTIVVLSKSDTVDAEELAFAESIVRDALTGTLARGAPIVPVSALANEGVDALRGAIHEALAALPARAPEAPAYLPIDRVFAIEGHGTIVAGTLMQGSIAAGDRLCLTPYGDMVRVRGLEVFGQKRTRVDGGSRVAIDLPGVETSDIARGAVLASAQFATHDSVEVRFRALRDAVPLLRRRNPVRAYLGAAEIIGTLVFETAPHDEAEARATLFLRRPTVVFPGAAFVVRRLSPKTLLGGGTVAALGAGPGTENGDTPEIAAVALALKGTGVAGSDAARIGASAGLREDAASACLCELVENGRALRLQKPPAYVDASLAAESFARVLERLDASQIALPWMVGMTSLTLARGLAEPELPLTRLLAVFVEDGRLAQRAGYYATPTFTPHLTSEQVGFFDRLFTPGLTQPAVPLREVTAAIRAAKIVGLAQAFDTLQVSGALVKVIDAVYRGEQIAAIRVKLETALRRDKQITVAAFRDVAGTSRKFAVPLLEWFDATGVTIRSGDVRQLRIVPRRPDVANGTMRDG